MTGEPASAGSGGTQTVRAAFNRLGRRFTAAGLENAALDARLLVCHAAGLSHEQFIAGPDRELAHENLRCLEDLAERRLAGRPLARLIGHREFWGRDFALCDDALVPRPDSELLVEQGLALLTGGVGAGAGRIADLGTGSGCLLVSLLADFAPGLGVGFDLSQDALATDRANARVHGVGGRALFARADWLAAAGLFDLIVANPPYIASDEIAGLAREVADHDPRLALDGGDDGLEAFRRIAAQARNHLVPGGALLAEVGSGQAAAVAALLAAQGLSADPAEDIFRDLAGVERVVRARKSD